MSTRTSTLLSSLLLSVSSAFLFASCNVANCEDLRDELFARKVAWQECNVDTDCIIIGGNNGDCTGVLSCNMSINKVFRKEAERRIASLPEETAADCIECRSPNCPTGEISICENRQCRIVNRIIDLTTL